MVTLKWYRLRSTQKKEEFHRNILHIIGKILKDEDFIELKKHRHHLFFNRYEHLINSSRIAYTLAKWLKADINSCTLAGILHDFHNTRIKSYMHWVMAAENAKKFDVNDKVQELIKSHMYPLWRTKITRAKGRDFWVVKMADFFSMCYELTYSVIFLSFRWKNKIKLKKNRILIERLTQEENVLLGEQT
jgi:putative nucleotidyltransferase with HDIG domain